MKTPRVAFAALSLVLAAVVTRPALADDEDEARAAMRRGVAAVARGEAELALVEYETAKRLVPEANVPYRYAADALAMLGRWEEAVANLEGYLAKNPDVSDAADVKARVAKIRAEHFPARLRVDVSAPDAEVIVDGARVVAPPAEDGGQAGAITLSPGKHRVEVRAPGWSPESREVDLVGERETTLAFVLVAAQRTAPAVDARASTHTPRTDGGRTMRKAGWVTLGVSAALVATAFVLDVAALGPAASDYRSAADRGDSSARALRDDALSLRTGTAITYGAGFTLAAAGAVLLLLAPRSPSGAAPRGGGGAPHAFVAW